MAFAVVTANNGVDVLRDNLSINNAALPSSLITPFTYTVHAGDGANANPADSFFQVITGAGIDFFDLRITSVTRVSPLGSSVPEPSTWAMMLVGLAGLGVAACRRTIKGRAATV